MVYYLFLWFGLFHLNLINGPPPPPKKNCYKYRVMEGQFRIKSINGDSHSVSFAYTQSCLYTIHVLISLRFFFFLEFIVLKYNLNIELKFREKWKWNFPMAMKSNTDQMFLSFVFSFSNKWYLNRSDKLCPKWPHKNWSSNY